MNLQVLFLLILGALIIYLNVATDERLEYQISIKFDMNCSLEKVCGDVVEISCPKDSDGRVYYAYKDNLAILETCSYECVDGNFDACKSCPPKEFECESEWFESKN